MYSKEMNGLTEFKRREKGIDRIESLEIVFIKSIYIFIIGLYICYGKYFGENPTRRIEINSTRITCIVCD